MKLLRNHRTLIGIVVVMLAILFMVTACPGGSTTTSSTTTTTTTTTTALPSTASPSASASAAPSATAKPSASPSPSASPGASPSASPSPGASASPSATAAGGGAPITINLTAQNLAFNMKTITVPAGSKVTVNFNNMDNGIPHNLAVYTNSSATTPIFVGNIVTGPATTTYTFTAPATPGTYYFRCDVHPTQMNGQFIVQ